MTKKVSQLTSRNQDHWYQILKEEFALAGWGEGTSIPFFQCNVPGEKLDPEKPKTPLFMPVNKLSQAELDEHGQYGRYDERSSSAAVRELGIESLQQEEGLDPQNSVFRFEYFSFQRHFGVGVYSGAETIADNIIKHDFTVTPEFAAAVSEDRAKEKLIEIANTINNASQRTGFDVNHVSSQQWAAIFRPSEAMVMGSIHLPNYQFNILTGARDTRFPGYQMEPMAALHSMLTQTNTRPYLGGIYTDAPPSVYIEAFPK